MSAREESFYLPHEKKIREYEVTLEQFEKTNKDNPLFQSEIKKLQEKLHQLKQSVYDDLSPWDRIQICRHPMRPHSIDYIKNMCDSFTELHGDRLYGDDHALVGGLATIGGEKFVVVGQEKGNDTDSRIYHNFGMMNPEGFRKALRLFKLAEKFNLPILSLLDTAGAYPGLEAEERGQGWAIAQNLREMAQIKTPIIVVVIGEGSSGGALGIGVGDTVGMLRHAYYSVISPEGCAAILWKDAGKNTEAAKTLKLNSENLLKFGVIDAIINEPMGGAHYEPIAVYASVKKFILEEWDKLKLIGGEELIARRYGKFRAMGVFATGESGQTQAESL